MSWISLLVALYGAGLSSVLGYLAWRKDRHSVRFFVSYQHRSDWYGLVITVVNVGFRPVTFAEVIFRRTGMQGYLNPPDRPVELPKRLEEGEQIELAFHAEDIEPDTTAFVMRDTHRRDHRLEFTPTFRAYLEAFCEDVRDCDPKLFAEGQQRIAARLRRDLAAARALAGGDFLP